MHVGGLLGDRTKHAVLRDIPLTVKGLLKLAELFLLIPSFLKTSVPQVNKLLAGPPQQGDTP